MPHRPTTTTNIHLKISGIGPILVVYFIPPGPFSLFLTLYTGNWNAETGGVGPDYSLVTMK